MVSTDTHPDCVLFPGSVKAGLYTVRIGVSMAVSPRSLTLKSHGRAFHIDREHVVDIQETSVLGLFKRGLRIVHNQPGIPTNIVFYPSENRGYVRCKMESLGWP